VQLSNATENRPIEEDGQSSSRDSAAEDFLILATMTLHLQYLNDKINNWPHVGLDWTNNWTESNTAFKCSC